MASLGKDLAAIRKGQDLSFDDIYEATKIPKRIISSIEDNSIFSEFEENITYIRSYVRSYAKALSIDDQQIVYALDKEELGTYSGSLLRTGDEKTGQPFDFEEEIEADNEKGEDETDETVNDHSPDPEPDSEPDTEAETSSQEAPSANGNYSERVGSVDWVNMGHQFQPLPPKSKLWIGVLLILILGAGGLYYFISGYNLNTPDKKVSVEPSQPTIPADSLKLDIVPLTDSDSMVLGNIAQNNQAQVALKTLPDTLHMVVYAAYGKLEPVRVYTDIMNNINPYWIEKGQAMRFNFVNEFRLRGQFNNLALMLNGHVIENYLEKFYDPDTRLLEIHRSFFEDNNKWLQPAPDSLAIDAPPPSAIQDHPTFNF